MAESADKTPSKDTTLDEDSEVVELTDEVGNASATEFDEDDVESMGLDMPEFKVPGTETDSSPDFDGSESKHDPDPPPTQRLPREALERVSATDEAASTERNSSSKRKSEASAVPGDEEAGYDRQELVKTIQMDAFDREAVETAASGTDGPIQSVLRDARFSPEIIPSPPTVLVKKWREGLPGEVALIVQKKKQASISPKPVDEEKKSPESEVNQGEKLPDLPAGKPEATELETKPSEADSEPIELDDELVELEDHQSQQVPTEESTVPPPGKGVNAGKKPPTKTEKKERPSNGSDGDSRDAAKSSESKKPKAADSEMKGLVQELLEEEREQKAAKSAKTRPRDVWFKKVFTEEYLRSVPSNIAEMTRDDVDFIESSLRLKKKSRILDLACGFGRHSLELANRGYEMVGLDISRPFLERALEAAKAQSLNVKFLRGDMRNLNFSGIFDGCFIWDTSLGFFDDRRNLGVLQGVARSLKVGGRLLIDVVNRDFIVPRTPTRLWWEGNGCIFLEESEFDYQTSTLEVQRSYIYEDGTPPLEQKSFIRLYNVHELRQMLHVAGFKVLEVSGAKHYKGRFLGATSERIIILAEKRKRRRANRSKKPTKPVSTDE